MSDVAGLPPLSERQKLQDFGAWLNEWGSIDDFPNASGEWKDGYEEAIRHVYDRFDAMYPEWAKWKDNKAQSPERSA